MENVSKLSLIKDYLLRMRPAISNTGEALSSFASHLREKYSLDAILEREKDEKKKEAKGATEHSVFQATFELSFSL